MDEKIIDLLEQINRKLESIDMTIKTIYKKEQVHSSNTPKLENERKKPKETSQTSGKEDALSNWESKMPYDETIKKFFPYRK